MPASLSLWALVCRRRRVTMNLRGEEFKTYQTFEVLKDGTSHGRGPQIHLTEGK